MESLRTSGGTALSRRTRSPRGRSVITNVRRAPSGLHWNQSTERPVVERWTQRQIFVAELVDHEQHEAPASELAVLHGENKVVELGPTSARRAVVRHATQTRIPLSISIAPPARTRASWLPGESREISLPEDRFDLVRFTSALLVLVSLWAAFGA